MMPSNRWSLRSVVLFGALVMASVFGVSRGGVAWAQGEEVTLTPSGQLTTGKLEYRRYCAQCHGVSGKGDGPVASALTKKPSDLTVLSKNNNGEFPSKRVYATVTGEGVVAAHGTRAMPIWGTVLMQAPSHVSGAGGQRTPERAKREVGLLVDYIKTIQVK